MHPTADERVAPSNDSTHHRLVRRFPVQALVEIEWLTARHRRGLRRRVVVPTAQVLDISSGGMLVEVPGRPRLEVGAEVELASEGCPATARVAHKHVALDPDKQLLGVEFVTMSAEFEATVHEVVKALRT